MTTKDEQTAFDRYYLWGKRMYFIVDFQKVDFIIKSIVPIEEDLC
jgi:hypothetical protein